MGFMATVKIKGLSNVNEGVRKLFEKIRTDESLLKDLGKELLTKTQDFNRAGLKPSDGKPHKPISSEWADRKEQLGLTNKKDQYYSAGASNVTFTGQLLRSLKIEVFSKQGSVELEASGDRTPYKNSKGTITSKARKNTPTNDELAGYLKEQKRPIFGVGRQLNNSLVRIVRTFLNETIKQSIFKSRKN